MNFRRLILIAAAFTAAVSCNKDDDTSTTPGLKGTMQIIGLPEFVAAGQKCTLKVEGAVHPEDKEMGYYWKVTPGMSTYDTTRFENGLDRHGNESDGSFTYEFPSESDSLLTYTIYCYAYASGYSSNYTASYTTTVKSGSDGSIRGIEYPSTSVNGTYYSTIGEQTWTVGNAFTGNAIAFKNSEVMSDIFGRYYNYEEAVSACEALGEEWMLPTKEDWEKLETFVKAKTEADPTSYGKSVAAALMANASFNGDLILEYWPIVGDITNSSGFSAIPVGYANTEADTFHGPFEYAVFWTATSVEDNAEMAYYRYLICDQPDMFTGKAEKKSFGASVRCIKK